MILNIHQTKNQDDWRIQTGIQLDMKRNFVGTLLVPTTEINSKKNQMVQKISHTMPKAKLMMLTIQIKKT